MTPSQRKFTVDKCQGKAEAFIGMIDMLVAFLSYFNLITEAIVGLKNATTFTQ